MKELRGEAERKGIIHALICNQWNITYTSKALGISQATLRYFLKKHNIKRPV
jgi:transcriptional regulator of acetoin/glycerol metabolism